MSKPVYTLCCYFFRVSIQQDRFGQRSSRPGTVISHLSRSTTEGTGAWDERVLFLDPSATDFPLLNASATHGEMRITSAVSAAISITNRHGVHNLRVVLPHLCVRSLFSTICDMPLKHCNARRDHANR